MFFSSSNSQRGGRQQGFFFGLIPHHCCTCFKSRAFTGGGRLRSPGDLLFTRDENEKKEKNKNNTNKTMLYDDDAVLPGRIQMSCGLAFFDGCVALCLVVSGKAAGIKPQRSRLSSTRKSVRNTSVIYSQSRVSHQTEEITNTIESSSRSAVSMADRIHPLSDLALHEPGELIRTPENNRKWKQQQTQPNKTKQITSINQT